MKKMEMRNFDCEIRAEKDEERGHILTGTPIVYGKRADLGWFDEIIEDGALNGADLKDVRFLVNHNIDMVPLARSRNNNKNSTMQLEVVPGVGMQIRVDLDVENNAEARALYSAVDRGDLTGMSFRFGVDHDEWEDIESDHPTRHIKGISRVLEVSAVTTPAYSQTSIQARGIPDALESAKESLDSVKTERAKIERHKKKIKILLEV